MRKIAVYMMCAVIALSSAACGAEPNESAGGISQEISSAALPNPFVDCGSLEEAIELAGFPISVPETVSPEFTERLTRAIKNEMIEIIYTNGDSGNKIRVRKAVGDKDVSGDYNQYAETKTVDVDSLKVTLKGDGGEINTATWANGEFSYAVSTEDGMGEVDMTALIRAVK